METISEIGMSDRISFSICIEAKMDSLSCPWVLLSQVLVRHRVENDRSAVADETGAAR